MLSSFHIRFRPPGADPILLLQLLPQPRRVSRIGSCSPSSAPWCHTALKKKRNKYLKEEVCNIFRVEGLKKKAFKEYEKRKIERHLKEKGVLPTPFNGPLLRFSFCAAKCCETSFLNASCSLSACLLVSSIIILSSAL